jgi:septal ring factor EnvC (AmiA/AmiB activator)
MPKLLPITDEIQQIKARLKELQNQQLEELRARRRELADELAHVEKQIADITGTPVQPAAAAGDAPRKRAPKLPKLVKESEEYKEIARNVQTILAKAPTGLNGKQIADELGFSQMNERNRIKELLNDNRFFKKTGQGVSTKFFLR